MSEATNEGEQQPTEGMPDATTGLTADNPDAQALLDAAQGGEIEQADAAETVEPRPWHGAANPFEALWQHFTAEIEKLKAAREA